ncbi:MAG: tyrosine-protein phosphatase [Rhodobiaceae bacterium]|nr:tyrosine-protein phosphatase [Rhodobiaceae bacterium]
MLRQEPLHKYPKDRDYDALRRPVGRLKAYANLLLADHGIFRPFYNRPSLVADGMWRSAQPTPGDLKALKDKGFRTIVNLRGPSPKPYYVLESQACRDLGLTLVDFRIRSRDLPYVWQLHDAKRLFEMIEYPALMHCKSGADRAGLMSALYLIIRKGVPVDEAIPHLSLKYYHFRHAKTGILDFMLERYRDDTADAPRPFLNWVEDGYDPEALTRDFHADFWPSLIVDRILRRE